MDLAAISVNTASARAIIESEAAAGTASGAATSQPNRRRLDSVMAQDSVVQATRRADERAPWKSSARSALGVDDKTRKVKAVNGIVGNRPTIKTTRKPRFSKRIALARETGQPSVCSTKSVYRALMVGR